MAAQIPTLHVCVTCRAGQTLEGTNWPGKLVYDAVAAALAARPASLDLRPVKCLAACERGCTAAISMPGKFGYLLGGLNPDHAVDLLDYAQKYAAAETGLVLPSRRAPTLRHAMIGRFPSPDMPIPTPKVAQ